ncbi:sensor histidine kinase [Pseudonocardia kunmingensis]|uniref:histidine kinase n=1 Tax=Pseudonocardia kunmingensis TaxID=630975 RepID=A0A543DW61_9PSEU|nr:sensor histidine kinase [Pseudonocardia kunmingensis]TQM13566.1 histidine kinase [Pseudonocardia kunmingensis]
MRTGRDRSRFYAAGWLATGVISAVAFVQWRAYVREVEQRAEEAERTREEAGRRHAVEERLHIARELHDSLTHSISVIKVQAGVAAHLARKKGEEPAAALLAIQEASSNASRELRATLDTLRRDDDANGAGLERMTALVEQARAAGLPVTVVVEGRARPLPPQVDQTAYRVIQEALTNVTRHAGEATATVCLRYRRGALTVRVTDDGDTSREPPVPGHGLIGMRERVTGLGGHLVAGPGPVRGFSVVAELPTNGRR